MKTVELPTDLAGCMNFIQQLKQVLSEKVAAVPATPAHAELDKLWQKLDVLCPTVLEHQKAYEGKMVESRQKIEANLQSIRENVAKTEAIRDGKVPQSQLDAMLVAKFGADVIPKKVPEMPTGWSNVLQQELLANAAPKSPTIINSLESNAWNDWQLESHS
jgi:hypothetical protein